MARCERPANADIVRTYADLGCPMARRGLQPGDEFVYSNSGYDLLGSVIERVSDSRIMTSSRPVYSTGSA